MVIVDPSGLADAAASLGSLGTSLEDANLMAGLPTTGILPLAADEVSAMITTLFNSHGQWYQGLASRAQQFHQLFTQTLTKAWEAYQNTEWSAMEFLWTETTRLEQPLVPLLGDIPGFNAAAKLPIPPLPTAPVGQTVALLWAAPTTQCWAAGIRG